MWYVMVSIPRLTWNPCFNPFRWLWCLKIRKLVKIQTYKFSSFHIWKMMKEKLKWLFKKIRTFVLRLKWKCECWYAGKARLSINEAASPHMKWVASVALEVLKQCICLSFATMLCIPKLWKKDLMKMGKELNIFWLFFPHYVNVGYYSTKKLECDCNVIGPRLQRCTRKGGKWASEWRGNSCTSRGRTLCLGCLVGYLLASFWYALWELREVGSSLIFLGTLLSDINKIVVGQGLW